MKPENGTIYFIGERDVIANATTAYYKIGLVRKSRRGDENTRAKEHQTGNPRELYIAAAQKSPAVQDLETRMHQQFAPYRIYGEWFEFSPSELKKAIAAAAKFAERQDGLALVVEKAEKNKGKKSNGRLLKPTAADQEIYAAYERANKGKGAITSILDDTKHAFDRVEGRDVSLFVSQIVSTKTEIDKDRLRQEKPDVYAECLKVQPVSAAFRWKSSGKSDSGITKSVRSAIDEQLALIEAVGRKRPSEALLIELHMGALAILQYKGLFDWDIDEAKALAQIRCGSYDGIDGICTWKRTGETRETFDSGTFKSKHSKLVDEYSTTKQTRSVGIVESRSYPTGK